MTKPDQSNEGQTIVAFAIEQMREADTSDHDIVQSLIVGGIAYASVSDEQLAVPVAIMVAAKGLKGERGGAELTDEGWNDFQQARRKLSDLAAGMMMALEDPADVPALYVDIGVRLMLAHAAGGAGQVADYLRGLADQLQAGEELPARMH